jgi:hypothetical protein
MARAISKNTTSKITAKRRRSSAVTVDPIVALVATADRALTDYVKTSNKLEAARAKFGINDSFSPSVPLPEAIYFLRSSPWPSDFRFTSERHIDEEFLSVTKRLKRMNSDARRGKKKPFTSDVAGLIMRNEMTLALLPMVYGPLKKAFRAEQRRVLAFQQKTGLLELSKRNRDTWAALFVVTEKIAKAKPATAAGALAMIRYVEERSWQQYHQELFCVRLATPAHFAQVLRAARQRLERSIAA